MPVGLVCTARYRSCGAIVWDEAFAWLCGVDVTKGQNSHGETEDAKGKSLGVKTYPIYLQYQLLLM